MLLRNANLWFNILNEIDHWLPSKDLLYETCDNDTTNIVEGFFGELKILTDFQ